MATTAITSADFEKTITDNEIVFVDFWATWCGRAARSARFSRRPPTSRRTRTSPSSRWISTPTRIWPRPPGIQAVPTLMIAKQGEVIFQQAGALQAADLDDLIAQAKALDLAAAKAAQSGCRPAGLT